MTRQDSTGSDNFFQEPFGTRCICSSKSWFAITCFLLVLLAVCFFHKQLINGPDPSMPFCQNDECREHVSYLSQAVDLSVEPCDDFYQFSCNKWMSNHSSWTGSETMPKITKRDQIRRQMMTLLIDALQDQVTPSKAVSVHLARTLFRQCLDVRQQEALGLQPITQIGVHILGADWHRNGDTNSHSLHQLIAQMTLLNLQPLFHLVYHCTSNSVNKTIIVPKISTPGKRHKVTSRNVPNLKLFDVFLDWLQTLNVSSKEALQLAKSVTEFKQKLSEMIPSKRGTYLQYTLGKFCTLTAFNWTAQVNQLAIVTEMSVRFTDTDLVYTNQVSYLRALSSLLSSSDHRTVRAYFAYVLLRKLLRSGPTNRHNLPSQCISLLEGDLHLTYAFSRLHLEKRRQVDKVEIEQMKSKKDQVKQLVVNLKEAFRRQLNDTDWLDEETRSYAHTKLNFMGEDISFPEWIWTDVELDLQAYGIKQQTKVTLLEGQYLLNFAQWTKLVMGNTFRSMQSLKRLEFLNYATYQVKAAYSPTMNKIIITNGILSSPVFHRYWPPPVTYGKLGFILGHEIVHGFDNTGQHFGKFGDKFEWWSKTSQEHFQSRSRCFIEQYEQEDVYETTVRINGSKTLGENIADNAGIRVAYSAFIGHMKDSGVSMKMGETAYETPYTLEQLFFIAFAKVYCKKYDIQFKAKDVLRQVHSPPRERINTVLLNFKEFAKAWKCQKRTVMNPPEGKKCRVY